KSLAGMYIRDMHLNHRRSDRTDSILQSDGRMGVSTRIQNDAVHIKTYLLNLVYQLSLNVGLEIVNLYIRIFLTEFGKVVFKSNATVNGRFTFAQEIYIGAVNNLYPHNTIFYTFAVQR